MKGASSAQKVLQGSKTEMLPEHQKYKDIVRGAALGLRKRKRKISFPSPPGKLFIVYKKQVEKN